MPDGDYPDRETTPSNVVVLMPGQKPRPRRDPIHAPTPSAPEPPKPGSAQTAQKRRRTRLARVLGELAHRPIRTASRWCRSPAFSAGTRACSSVVRSWAAAADRFRAELRCRAV